jgi:YopX protein
MREIKFRAWDEDTKRMWWDVFGSMLQDDHYKVMQYTNLKDKNGKEIYEGDIVTQNYPGAWEVVYEAPKYILQRHDNPVSDTFRKSTKHIEIIGNIYQHPNLLTNEK